MNNTIEEQLNLPAQQLLQLLPEEIDALWQHLTEHVEAIEDYKQPEHEGFLTLMSAFGVCPPALQKSALEKKVFYPAELYYGASEEIAKELSDLLLQAPNSAPLLECLAMQGGDIALATYVTLNSYSDEWKQSLSPFSYEEIVPLYAQTGGWTLGENGEQLALHYNTCLPLVRGDRPDPSVQTMRPRTDHCPRCGAPMFDVLSLNTEDPRLSFLKTEDKITACCCMECVCWDTYFSQYTPQGQCTPIFSSELMEQAAEPKKDSEAYLKQLTEHPFVLDKTPASVFYAKHDWNKSSVGGFAHWIDDPLHTACPHCGKPMIFVAQLYFKDWCEGTLYIEACTSCKTTSVHYQQS